MFPAAKRIPLPSWLLALWIIVAAWTFLPDTAKNRVWEKFSYSLTTSLQKSAPTTVNQQDKSNLFRQIASEQTYPVNFCDPDGRLGKGMFTGERSNLTSNIGADIMRSFPEGPAVQNFFNNLIVWKGDVYQAAQDTLRGGPLENVIIRVINEKYPAIEKFGDFLEQGFSTPGVGGGLGMASGIPRALTTAAPKAGTLGQSAKSLHGAPSSAVANATAKMGNRASEFLGGKITESGFLDAVTRYLGKNYTEISPGRYMSIDRMHQVRFGPHEVRGPQLHGHFEAYNVPGGRVVENTRVNIVPDP